MYQLTRPMGLATSLRREGLNLGLSLVIAESLFRLGSFSLEAIAFLVTWFGLSWLGQKLLPAAPISDVPDVSDLSEPSATSATRDQKDQDHG